MRPFDLDAARKGAKLVTAEGEPARIINFDAKGKFHIIALVDIGSIELPYAYNDKGEYICREASEKDLMLDTQRRVGWVNINQSVEGGRYFDRPVFATEAGARASAMSSTVATVKVEWEE